MAARIDRRLPILVAGDVGAELTDATTGAHASERDRRVAAQVDPLVGWTLNEVRTVGGLPPGVPQDDAAATSIALPARLRVSS